LQDRKRYQTGENVPQWLGGLLNEHPTNFEQAAKHDKKGSKQEQIGKILFFCLKDSSEILSFFSNIAFFEGILLKYL